MNRKKLLIALGIALLAALAIGGPLSVTLTDQTKQEQEHPPLDLASNAASRFLDRYVQPDGRVARIDQGGDTVSEGQAYAMLIAVATGDKARFDNVWLWAQLNLRQDNGLMAWKWQNGKVVDPQPATDADMDAARALALAASKFKDKAYSEEARVLAGKIADNELGYTVDKKPVLVAGPWAKGTPFYANPSYHSPRAEQVLGDLTKDARWAAVMQGERQRTAQLINADPNKITLPPDWSNVDDRGNAQPAPAPNDPKGAPEYAYDAVRLPVRLAESCDEADRQQAAKLWTVLNRSTASRTSAGLSLNGDVKNKQQTAVGAVAAAAGAHAALDQSQEMNLLDLADRIDTNNKTYYGAAWAALGRIMLTTDWLGSC